MGLLEGRAPALLGLTVVAGLVYFLQQCHFGGESQSSQQLRAKAPEAAPKLRTFNSSAMGFPNLLDNLKECTPPKGWAAMTFTEAAQNARSDKVRGPVYHFDDTHAYAPLYQRYLEPLQTRGFRMLEIGLGCNMPFGAGGSVLIWRQFIPCASLTIFEYNKQCADEFASKTPGVNMIVGDQSNPADLNRAVQQHGPFDVIVDDGGHSWRQQITSLRTLFPTVKPGGLMVTEDLQTSYFGNDKLYADDEPHKTTMHFVLDVIRHLLRPMPDQLRGGALPGSMEGAYEIARLATEVRCIQEACVFVRNAVPA